MKKLFFLAGAALIWVSCTNNNKTASIADSTKTNDMTGMKVDNKAGDDKNLKVATPSFTNVDAGVSSSINKVIGDYLKIKDALVADDASGASDAAGTLSGDLKGLDKTKFSAEQKSAFEKNEDDMKENAEHINEKKVLGHQREHFGMLSDDMVDLVKSFGSANPLYNDHCPMANDKKGSNWISENKAISNPYMGKKDVTCGSVVEVIKK